MKQQKGRTLTQTNKRKPKKRRATKKNTYAAKENTIK